MTTYQEIRLQIESASNREDARNPLQGNLLGRKPVSVYGTGSSLTRVNRITTPTC